MDQLADETLRLIFSYLQNPDALSKVNRRLHDVSKDPYVRSEFFLCNHGKTYAFWAAFARSACLNADVINILHSSGAHISRYLTQAVVQSYTRGRLAAPGPYNWARGPKLNFATFAHFLKLASTLYPVVDVSKGEDDGTIFVKWIRQKQGNQGGREKAVPWETIESLFKDNGFIPFAPRDYALSMFPDALAIEPRLLPLAKQNGLVFDDDFRDTAFRSLFAETGKSLQDDQRQIAITKAAKDLSDLDEMLFVSKNVVGEVLMELDSRKAAFESLKVLDREGRLRFDLAEASRELIKTFRSTRSITTRGETVQQLYRHFPTSDAVVREIVIVTVFLEDKDIETTHEKLDSLELLPLTDRDVAAALSNPFSDKVADKIIQLAADHAEDVNLDELVFDSCVRAIDNPSKGLYLLRVQRKLADDEDLKTAQEGIHHLKSCLARKIRAKYTLNLADLKPDPLKSGGPGDKFKTKTKIGFDYEKKWDSYHLRSGRYGTSIESDNDESGDETDDEEEPEPVVKVADTDADHPDAPTEVARVPDGDVAMAEAGPGPSTVAQAAKKADKVEVGGKIEQKTLTAKIREEQTNRIGRGRRRRRYYYASFDRDKPEERMKYPANSLPTAVFVHGLFGPNDDISRIFLDHAVVNGNSSLLAFAFAEGALVSTRHFKILSKLGRPPLACMWAALEYGEFLDDEFDDKVVAVEKKEAITQLPRTPAVPPPAAVLMDVEAAAPVAPAATLADTPAPPADSADIVASDAPLQAEVTAALGSLAPTPAPTVNVASDAPSTSLAASRPRRSTVTKHYEEDEMDVDAAETGTVPSSSKKAKSKAPAVKKPDLKGKGKATDVVDRKGKGREVVLPAAVKKAAGPFERERLKWIGFLCGMLKDEEAKIKTRRKEQKATAAKGARAQPVKKTEFHRSLLNHYPILCNFDKLQRGLEGLAEIPNYNKLFAEPSSKAANVWESDGDDQDVDEQSEEEEDELIDDGWEDEQSSQVDLIEEEVDDDEVDQLASDDNGDADGGIQAAPVNVPAKRKRAPAKPKSTPAKPADKGKKPATTGRGAAKKTKVDAGTPKPKPKAKSKAKAKSTPNPKASAAKPKAQSSASKGKGKAKANGASSAHIDTEEAKRDAHDAVFGKSDEDLSDLSEDEAGADEEMEALNEVEKKEVGPSGSGSKGDADDSGVFMDGEVEMDELPGDREELVEV